MVKKNIFILQYYWKKIGFLLFFALILSNHSLSHGTQNIFNCYGNNMDKQQILCYEDEYQEEDSQDSTESYGLKPCYQSLHTYQSNQLFYRSEVNKALPTYECNQSFHTLKTIREISKESEESSMSEATFTPMYKGKNPIKYPRYYPAKKQRKEFHGLSSFLVKDNSMENKPHYKLPILFKCQNAAQINEANGDLSITIVTTNEDVSPMDLPSFLINSSNNHTRCCTFPCITSNVIHEKTRNSLCSKNSLANSQDDSMFNNVEEQWKDAKDKELKIIHKYKPISLLSLYETLPIKTKDQIIAKNLSTNQ